MPYMCTAYTVDYIGVTRNVSVVSACRRFDYSNFCRRFGAAVLTCRRFDHRPVNIHVVATKIRIQKETI